MKTSVSFRISAQALKNLEYICQKSGVNQTAAVEIALASFAISLGCLVESAPALVVEENLLTQVDPKSDEIPENEIRT